MLRNRSTRVLAVGGIAAVLMMLLPGLPASPALAAGQNSCSSGNYCLSDWHSGSTTYGFTGSVDNLNSYTFSNAHVVGNDVGYGRNRNSTFTLMCMYAGINRGAGGSANSGNVPYS